MGEAPKDVAGEHDGARESNPMECGEELEPVQPVAERRRRCS